MYARTIQSLAIPTGLTSILATWRCKQLHGHMCQNVLLQPFEHVRKGFSNRKSPKDYISGIQLLLRCAEYVRFVAVGSKIPLSGSTNIRGIWGTPLYTQNQPGGSRVLKGGEYGPIGGVCSAP